ncbi:MAG: hypothetical protein CEN87_551 [Parcubacteria group bacterium Licking1014_1]|nr:MAG: hypothetical protein CEN87_551 [Parcubacteria group bacterium Licking1014_1]
MEYSFLMIKPDAYNRDRDIALDIKNDILLMCQQQGLSVVYERTKRLTRDDVVKIYPTIFQKSFFREFITLMTSNLSILILLSGVDAIKKTKIIRGFHKTKESNETLGIRGKYCYVEDISPEDIAMLKANCHPQRKRLVDIIIEGIVHAPDTPDELPVVLDIFGKKE